MRIEVLYFVCHVGSWEGGILEGGRVVMKERGKGVENV
jgi:hypothetical protein